MFTTLSRAVLPFALVAGMATAASAQSFTDLAYTSPINPDYPVQNNTHLCRWNGQSIGPGYAGGTWSGFAALDLRDYLFSGGQTSYGRCFREGRTYYHYVNVAPTQSLTGYQQQYGSYDPNATNVVAIGSEQASFSYGNPFTLQSMLVGAGWGNVQNLSITGWLNGSQVWTQNYSFLGTGGAFQVFGMAGAINEVRFNATYATGANADPYNSVGEQLGYGYEDMSPYRTFFVDNIQTSTVPEPSTYALMGAGLLALGAVARRRKRQG